LQKKAVFPTANARNDADNSQIIAGIWQSGNGLASDSHGNVYAFTGNNNPPVCPPPVVPSPDPADLSESIIRLKLSGNQFQQMHVRVPEADALDKCGNDGDLGAGGPILPFDNVLVGGGKQGVVYTLRNPASDAWPAPKDLDGFQAFYNTWLNPPPFKPCDPLNTKPVPDYSSQTNGPNMHGSLVVFKPPLRSSEEEHAIVYAMPEKDYLRAFKVYASGRVIHCPMWTTAGQVAPTAPNDLRSFKGMPGGFLSISANGNLDGIVWASVPCIKTGGTDCPEATNTAGEVPGRLIAFEAIGLRKLWEDSGSDCEAEPVVYFAKFVPPTVAGGRVFRAAYEDKIFVYGLKAIPPCVIDRPARPRWWLRRRGAGE
jgi:hypothetical protein